jgi:prepilin-type processing-associated H-X9-DG protein
MNASIRRAFSLTELICVLAIIVATIGLLLPAVQNAREAARRVNCQSNLRQLGIALAAHESSFKYLPPGTLGSRQEWRVSMAEYPGWDINENSKYFLHNNQNTSWIVHVLPYFEQSSVSMRLPQICTSVQSTYQDYLLRSSNSVLPRRLVDDPEVKVVSNLPLPLLFCPSDNLNGEQILTTFCGSQPAFIDDFETDGFIYSTVNYSMQGTNYAACSGASSGGFTSSAEIQQFAGVFACRTPTKNAHITDGLSNTVSIGETLGEISAGTRISLNPWVFATMCRGRSDMKWMMTESARSPGLELIGDNWFNHQAGFGSKHSTGANFLFSDGSIRMISRQIEVRTLYRLCGKSDHEIQDSSH